MIARGRTPTFWHRRNEARVCATRWNSPGGHNVPGRWANITTRISVPAVFGDRFARTVDLAK